jgi:hypothetical protein
MILIAPWIDWLPVRMLAVSSALLSASANVGLLAARTFSIQLLLGSLVGLGFGCVFAATIAAAAASEEPDRLYAIGNGGSLLLTMTVMPSLPIAVVHLGAYGIFVGIAVLALASCMFFLAFKRGIRTDQMRVAAAK